MTNKQILYFHCSIHSFMASPSLSKRSISAEDERESLDRPTLEMYQSFMAGYVRRINEATFKVSIGGIRIGSAKYSRLAQINLKSRIMTFSRYAIENVPERGRRYLVIHELAHVKESSHNKHFWDLVGQFEPNYRQIGKSLELAFKENVDKTKSADDAGVIALPGQEKAERFGIPVGLFSKNHKLQLGQKPAGLEPEASSEAWDDFFEQEVGECLEDDLDL